MDDTSGAVEKARNEDMEQLKAHYESEMISMHVKGGMVMSLDDD